MSVATRSTCLLLVPQQRASTRCRGLQGEGCWGRGREAREGELCEMGIHPHTHALKIEIHTHTHTHTHAHTRTHTHTHLGCLSRFCKEEPTARQSFAAGTAAERTCLPTSCPVPQTTRQSPFKCEQHVGGQQHTHTHTHTHTHEHEHEHTRTHGRTHASALACSHLPCRCTYLWNKHLHGLWQGCFAVKCVGCKDSSHTHVRAQLDGLCAHKPTNSTQKAHKHTNTQTHKHIRLCTNVPKA